MFSAELKVPDVFKKSIQIVYFAPSHPGKNPGSWVNAFPGADTKCAKIPRDLLLPDDDSVPSVRLTFQTVTFQTVSFHTATF